jgi:hypothetical protein
MAGNRVPLARAAGRPQLIGVLSRRLATALSVAVVLAGGAALAQADLIVDPWKRVLAGKAPAPAVPVAPERKPGQRADSGWFEGKESAPAPRPVVEPWSPPVGETVTDPWAPRAAVAPQAPPLAPAPAPAPIVREPPSPLHASNWARVLPEIIDPWGPRRLAAYRDPLIVDPWPN